MLQVKTMKMNREEVQSKGLQVLLENDRCSLGISMGVGKTRIAINHMKQCIHGLAEFLIVAPKHSIIQAWIDEIGKLGYEELLQHITFSTYLSLNKKNPNDYDIVYLDECHSLLYSHESFLSLFKGKIVGLTGTPPKRKGSDKYRMVNKYCPVKFEFGVDEAASNKILNDYKIIVHNLELTKFKNLKKKNKKGGYWFTSEVDDYIYSTERYEAADTPKKRQFSAIMRMKAMMDYTTKEIYTKSLMSSIKSKCIVFANTQKQADRLCDHSYHSGNNNSDKNFELFSDGRIDKLSCVLQLSEGVTIPKLKNGIIMHAYGNERKTSQRIGRLLRLNPNETAICHILCYKNTVDAKWVDSALKSFDQSKVSFYDPIKKIML